MVDEAQKERFRRWSWMSDEHDEEKKVEEEEKRKRSCSSEKSPLLKKNDEISLAAKLLKPVERSEEEETEERMKKKKLPVADDIKLAAKLYELSGGKVEAYHKASRKAKKNRGGSAGDIEIPKSLKNQQSSGDTSSLNISKRKRKPLKKTTSLQITIEDDTTSHPHRIVQPKPSVYVKTIEADAFKRDKFYAWMYLILLLLASCLYFHLIQNFLLVDAIYFSIVTITTVGYGDLVPPDNPSRIFAIILFFVGAGAVGNLVGATLNQFVQEAKKAETKVKKDVREVRRRSSFQRRESYKNKIKSNDNNPTPKEEICTISEEDNFQEQSKNEIAERIAQRRAQKNPWRRLKQSLFQLLAWTLGGAIWFSILEPKISILDAIYWSCSTLTTVGYGDFRPSRQASKIFAIFFILGGTSICIRALGSIAAMPIEAHKLQAEERVLSQYGDRLTQEDFLELTRGELVTALNGIEDGSLGTNLGRRCTKAQFTLAHLVKLGKIEIDDVHECFLYFDCLDKHKHGYICVEDVLHCSGDKNKSNHHHKKKVHHKDKYNSNSPQRHQSKQNSNDSPKKNRPVSDPLVGRLLQKPSEPPKTYEYSTNESSYDLTDDTSTDFEQDDQTEFCHENGRPLDTRTVPNRSVTYSGDIPNNVYSPVRERWRRASKKLNAASKLRRTSLYRPQVEAHDEAPSPVPATEDANSSCSSNSNLLSLLDVT